MFISKSMAYMYRATRIRKYKESGVDSKITAESISLQRVLPERDFGVIIPDFGIRHSKMAQTLS